jgi:hypothetical protein
VHQRRAFGRKQRQAQVAFAPPAHRDVLGQTRRRSSPIEDVRGCSAVDRTSWLWPGG